MPTHLILSIDRRNTAAEAMEVVDLAIKHAPHGVVGVDLCGDPMKGDPAIFRAAFAKAKAHGLRITLHFAEVPASGTLEELETLLSFGPDRLGHVIHVPKDVEEEIIGRKLGLELCLSGNINAKLVEGGFVAHHFGWWREQLACPVVLCVSPLS
jgi:adenosine deaminase